MTKKNPYTRLLERARQYAFDVRHRYERTMWKYPKEKLAGSWRLDDLAERVQAGDQLGYDVQLKVVDGDLIVRYIKRVEPPYELL